MKLNERSVYVFLTLCFCVLETFQRKILSKVSDSWKWV